MEVWIGELQTILKIVPSCPDRYVISKYVFYKKIEKQKTYPNLLKPNLSYGRVDW